MKVSSNVLTKCTDYFLSLESRYASISGYIYCLLANFFFCIANMFIRKSRMTPHFQLYYLRMVGMTLIMYFLLKRQKQLFVTKSPFVNKVLLIIGILSLIGGAFNFYGFQKVPLNEAAVVLQTMPIFTGILAVFMLGETYDLIQFFSTILCTIGVVFILKPPFFFPERIIINTDDELRIKGIICVLVASFCFSFQSLAIKKIVARLPPNLSTFYIGMIPALLISFMQVNSEVKLLNVSEWLLALGVTIAGSLAQVFFNRGFRFGDAGKIMIMGYSQILFAYILDIFILGTEIDFLSMIGSAMIFSCVFFRIYKTLKTK